MKTRRRLLMVGWKTQCAAERSWCGPRAGLGFDVTLREAGTVQWSVEGKRCSREEAYRFLVRCDHEWTGMPTPDAPPQAEDRAAAHGERDEANGDGPNFGGLRSHRGDFAYLGVMERHWNGSSIDPSLARGHLRSLGDRVADQVVVLVVEVELDRGASDHLVGSVRRCSGERAVWRLTRDYPEIVGHVQGAFRSECRCRKHSEGRDDGEKDAAHFLAPRGMCRKIPAKRPRARRGLPPARGSMSYEHDRTATPFTVPVVGAWMPYVSIRYGLAGSAPTR